MKSFNNWWKELEMLYSKYFPGCSLSHRDKEDWRDYWEDGFSPKDTLHDEAIKD